MPLNLPKPFDPYKRQKKILNLFVIICFFGITGCSDKATAVSQPTQASQRKKPEGQLLISREIDLGTLPVGGSLEAMLAVKNPDSLNNFRIELYEISQPGFSVEPKKFEVTPGMTSPISFLVRPEATKNAGVVSCDVTALDAQKQLMFRTTLRLKVE